MNVVEYDDDDDVVVSLVVGCVGFLYLWLSFNTFVEIFLVSSFLSTFWKSVNKFYF